MQVFKAALRVVLRHPLYLLVYAVFLSFMGVLMASSLPFGEAEDAEFVGHRTRFSVIDRDGSDLSQGLAAFLGERGEEVPLEDTPIALQDAVAKGQSGYVVNVPEGFGQALMDAAASGGDVPELETVYSYYSLEGNLMDQEVNEYLGVARAYAGLLPDASQADVAAHAGETMASSASVETVQLGGGSSEAQRFVFYLDWGTYTLFASIIVCVGLLMGTINRTDLHRRNLVSPVPSLTYNLQVAAAALLVMAAVWLWAVGLGLVVFSESVAQIGGFALALMLVLTFAFATVPLSIGFLLGQLGVGEFASNAIGNIAGMVVSFLGGVWISFDLLDPAVQTVAHFSPAYWYTSALQKAVELEAPTPEALGPILGDMGVLLLFTAAIFAIALVIGRVRVQSAEAGGNAAASRSYAAAPAQRWAGRCTCARHARRHRPVRGGRSGVGSAGAGRIILAPCRRQDKAGWPAWDRREAREPGRR